MINAISARRKRKQKVVINVKRKKKMLMAGKVFRTFSKEKKEHHVQKS